MTNWVEPQVINRIIIIIIQSLLFFYYIAQLPSLKPVIIPLPSPPLHIAVSAGHDILCVCIAIAQTIKFVFYDLVSLYSTKVNQLGITPVIII